MAAILPTLACAQQPENNIVRGAYYALISALSGAQTMALCCYDEAYTIPTEKASLLSLRTMQILADEMGLCDTVDPLAGSYYVETLTNQMRGMIEEIMADVDARGGIVKLISEGAIQAAVSAQAYEMRKKIESGDFKKVGVNCYQMEEEGQEVAFHPFREEDTRAQIDSVNRVRARRDAALVDAALARVGADAKAGDNVMPAIMDAVKAYATVGELTNTLVAVYGRFKEPIRF